MELVARDVHSRRIANGDNAYDSAIDRRDWGPMGRVVVGDKYSAHERQRRRDGEREAERDVDRAAGVVASGSAPCGLCLRSGTEGHLGVLVTGGARLHTPG